MSIFSKPQAAGASPFSNTNPFQASANQNKPSPFGLSLNTNTGSSQPQASSSLFGQNATVQAQPAASGMFGSTVQQQPQQSSGNLFDRISQPQQQQGTSNIFGGGGGSQQQPTSNSSLFGGTTLLGSTSTQQPQANASNAFGGSSSIFGGSQQQPSQGTSNIFGGSTNQQQPQQPSQGTSNILGGSTNQQQPQQPQGGSIFGASNRNVQQQPPGQQQGSMLQSRMFQNPDVWPRPRTVTDQIEVAFSKWNPQSANTVFRTYLYNSVPPEQAPFFSPSVEDDEAQWEEALRKKPSPGAVPVMVRGFEQLGLRMRDQHRYLMLLQGRLHEINDGLEMLLRKHDVDISTRAATCRRKHLKLSHQCLGLAAKVQVLKNRGYAMESAEEELRRQLVNLERNVFDPALSGRGEEIWARMVSVREQGRQLQRAYERAGQNLAEGASREIDEEVLQRASKILEDYHQQLSHLKKELTKIQKDFADWQGGSSGASVNGSAR